MKAIVYQAPATRQMIALPVAIHEAIAAKLARHAATGAGDVKALSGLAAKRLRVGDYRVVFEETDGLVDVVAVAHRRDIYR